MMEPHLEAFRFGVRHNKRFMAAFLLNFAAFGVLLIPSGILEAISIRPVFVLLSPRNSHDLDYLLTHGHANFADVYIGGYLLILGMSFTSLLMASYYIIRSPSKIFVTDFAPEYRKHTMRCAIGVLAGAWVLASANDFSLISFSISWFADNPNSSLAIAPQPATRAVFFWVWIGYFVIGMTIPNIVAMAVSYLCGQRISRAEFAELFKQRTGKELRA
ncbi:MAG: hypothetical protein QM744_02765 [Mesorhizobium sp.]